MARGHRRVIRGASDGDPDLAAIIRAKVAAGQLPRHRPAKMWVGPGSGKVCDACGLSITTGQREYEFDPPGSPTIRLHQPCLELWRAVPVEYDGEPSHDETSAARIAALLRGSVPAAYCVGCLAAKLNVPITEIRHAAQLLITRPGFEVTSRACHACGLAKDGVVTFVSATSRGAVGQ
jgi:hypothetical protein